MPLIDKPIQKRAGYQEGSTRDAMAKDLSALAEKHGLIGCVLVSFTMERVGARAWGKSDVLCDAMDTLGQRILTDIDDGRHDPLEFLEPEGKA